MNPPVTFPTMLPASDIVLAPDAIGSAAPGAHRKITAFSALTSDARCRRLPDRGSRHRAAGDGDGVAADTIVREEHGDLPRTLRELVGQPAPTFLAYYGTNALFLESNFSGNAACELGARGAWRQRQPHVCGACPGKGHRAPTGRDTDVLGRRRSVLRPDGHSAGNGAVQGKPAALRGFAERGVAGRRGEHGLQLRRRRAPAATAGLPLWLCLHSLERSAESDAPNPRVRPGLSGE